MPAIPVRFYADEGNIAPVLEWLDEQPEKLQVKVIAAIERLRSLGHEARRPLWAPL